MYIVAPVRPDAIMEDELSTENKAVDCPDLTKITYTQGPGAAYKVETFVFTRVAAPFPNLGPYRLC